MRHVYSTARLRPNMTADDQRRRGKVSRRLVILAFIALMNLGPAARAEEHQVPICTDDEFLYNFNMIVEYQILFDAAITNANELQLVSRAQIENREYRLSQLPLCSDAIAIQRLLIQLAGDSLARAALELADLPADDNPYLQRLPDDQTRIEDLVSAMLGIDRSEAAPTGQRSLPSCAPDDMSMLDDAVATFLDLHDSTGEETRPAESLAAVDRLLLWREDNIPLLPECAESIDLIQALSAAATDSATYEAFIYGRVSADRNPFPPLVSAGIAKLTSWRDQRQVTIAAQAAPSTSSYVAEGNLPPCTHEELSTTNDSLQSEYLDLIQRADAVDSIVDLLDYVKAQIAFRKSRLAQLPICAEALDAHWWLAEVLADVALQTAVELGAPRFACAAR